MISVTEAKNIVQQHVPLLDAETIPLSRAAGFTLAEDVVSTVDVPGFTQSSMDGYAFSHEGWKQHETLTIAFEIAAGNEERRAVSNDTAARIFTGAALPPGADTVVMQEKTRVENGLLHIDDEQIQRAANVRGAGSDVKKHSIALARGSLLSPPAIGLLASIGVSKVKVFRRPSVSIIATGDELQLPGNPLAFGQVYESNSLSLAAALKQLGITVIHTHLVKDVLPDIIETITEALAHSDFILLCGGVSVGDYDLVVKALEACAVKKQFHGIKQRPGKPLYFGTRGNTMVFGLPGNPSSVLTCFYQYVAPAIQKAAGKKGTLHVQHATLTNKISKQTSLTHFLKGWFDGTSVQALDGQESYKLNSFARANCLIKIEEQVQNPVAGSLVEIHILPH